MFIQVGYWLHSLASYRDNDTFWWIWISKILCQVGKGKIAYTFNGISWIGHFLFCQKYEENIIGRDAFRFVMLPIAKIQIVLKKSFYIDIFKAIFRTNDFCHGGLREKDIMCYKPVFFPAYLLFVMFSKSDISAKNCNEDYSTY